jgi:hypothetical protein
MANRAAAPRVVTRIFPKMLRVPLFRIDER